MQAYFDNVRKEVPENIHDIFLEKEGTAVITIDMHEGHLSEDPDCPCPSPRGRQIIKPLNEFMEMCIRDRQQSYQILQICSLYLH